MHGYAELIEGWRDKCREVESERDTLRAEVEVLRRDIAGLRQAFWNIALNLELSQNMNPDQMRFALENIQAISEAKA